MFSTISANIAVAIFRVSVFDRHFKALIQIWQWAMMVLMDKTEEWAAVLM
jgi:hypothetical protein